MPEYVPLVDYVKEITEIRASIDVVKSTVQDLKDNDVREIKNELKGLTSLLKESNGGKSVIDRLITNEEKVEDLSKKVDSIIKQDESRLRRFYDTFWKYLIRLSIVSVFLALSYLMSSDPGILKELLKYVRF